MTLIDKVYKNRNIWREKILKYRDSKIYNFGHASGFLAEFLIKEFRK